ncbi:MAG: DUF2490 domain-containing protein [Bacteroidales bacterium]
MKNTALKISCVLLIAFGFTSNAYTQDNDWTSWQSLKVSHKFMSDFAASLKLETRLKDDFGVFDRWGLAAGASYRILPFLKAETGYEFHHRYRGSEIWKVRYRYQFGLSASTKWNGLQFSLRERFQQTFDQGNVETRLRSRGIIGYKPNNSILTPYFSMEVYQPINEGSFWHASRLRYRPGIQIALSDKWSADVFYMYQTEEGVSKNVIGFEFGYEL